MKKRRDHVLIIGSDAMMMYKFHYALISELLSSGRRITIAAPPSVEGDAFILQLVARGAAHAELPLSRNGLNPIGDAGGFLAMFRLMRITRPDAVLVYTVKPVIYGLLAAWLAGVPRRVALITGLGYAFTGKAAGRRRAIQLIVSNLYRQALRHASIVLFQNADDEKKMRAAGILRASTPSQVVDGCGVDVDYYVQAPLPPWPMRFLMIARVIADKGVREFVEAARIVRARHPDVVFRLVGGLDSNPGAITAAEIERWVEEGAIVWNGPVNDVVGALADSHVFVLPSYREGLPQSTIEALASGRAIVTTDVPGCRETVIDNETGFLIPPQSAKALAEACLRFVDAPELMTQFGRAARHVAETRFSTQRINAIVIGLIDA
ncbi:glycosyltransferase family 4 protein (plasmid) [Sphingomonadaceae bacterium OTU29LAMAA1]|nr:glycosyltransferase family 4 protein [Sphingomonadaceae bacterium OTU29LAMAA1]